MMDNKFPQRDVVTAIAGALSEWLFAVLPLVVVALVWLHLGELSSVLESPEWAFGASVLAGLALVKFVVGVARAGGLSLERVLLGVAGVFVIVVVPANTVLVLVILSEAENHHVPILLAVSQAALFCLSSLVFVFVGILAYLWTKRSERSGIAASNDS
jgi:hypothetical protein